MDQVPFERTGGERCGRAKTKIVNGRLPTNGEITLNEQFDRVLTARIRFTFIPALIFQKDLIDCQSRRSGEKIKARQTGIVRKKKITDGNEQETMMID